jgi:hypothetical protein
MIDNFNCPSTGDYCTIREFVSGVPNQAEFLELGLDASPDTGSKIADKLIGLLTRQDERETAAGLDRVSTVASELLTSPDINCEDGNCGLTERIMTDYFNQVLINGVLANRLERKHWRRPTAG